jgi:hypothetical protein
MTLQNLINALDYSAVIEIYDIAGNCLLCGNRMELDIPDSLIDEKIQMLHPGIVTKVFLYIRRENIK